MTRSAVELGQVNPSPVASARPTAFYSLVTDPLDDLPPASRREVVEAVGEAWRVDVAGAEAILRASEPFWNVLEDHHGVDSWGGGEFCSVFPAALAFIRRLANP